MSSLAEELSRRMNAEGLSDAFAGYQKNTDGERHYSLVPGVLHSSTLVTTR
jgi:hypothetical protein